MSEPILRPNIRIEIQNNLAETMEVDEEGEEGEITDATDNFEDTVVVEQQQIVRQTQRVWPNSNGGFTTGINIFDKQEQGKLVERAKRFALHPDDICNFSDAQLQELHDSLGITTEDEKDIRFEAIHVRGTDEMSTEDVLLYYARYGPAGVEWVNDESCNVVWDDKISAARALFFLSKPIRGMPVEGPCDPFVKELITKPLDDTENATGRSILLKDREIELRDDLAEDSFSVVDITVPIPPGYWRLGTLHPKSKCLLVRFAMKTDKKPIRAEKFSDYYRKYGNPNFGGMKGLITESHKRKFKGILDRNEGIPEPEKDSRNPWGVLAQNWNHDSQFCEKESMPIDSPTKNKSDIMSRIGFKRALDQDDAEPEESKVQKRVKVPRMRMYADEEEERVKRRRELMKIKKKVPKEVVDKPALEDLRAILKSQNKKPMIAEKITEICDEEPDLGLKLKNRNRFLSDEPRRRNDEKPRRREDDDAHRRYSKCRESPERFTRPMRSDDFIRRRRRAEDYQQEEEFDSHKPRSKVAVVIKTQKKPTVASTVWSRINADRERLKTVSEGKLRRRSSSSDSESSDSTTSEPSSSSESEESLAAVKTEKPDVGLKARPGFQTGLMSRLKVAEHRSPLRIEINNDHFKKE